MDENQGYIIRRSVLFDNGRGFALGENPKAPNPFVTWQFTQEDGKRDYYWGHYHNEEGAALGDFNRRVFDYERQPGIARVEIVPRWGQAKGQHFRGAVLSRFPTTPKRKRRFYRETDRRTA